MRIFCLTLILTISFFVPRAMTQTEESAADSVETELYKCWGYYNTNFDSLIICLETVFPKLEKIQDWETYLMAHNVLSLASYEADNYKLFEHYIFKSFEISETHFSNDHPQCASALNNLSMYYKEVGDLEKAIETYKHALKIQNKLNAGGKTTITILQNISSSYKRIGEYDLALDFLNQAYSIQQDSFPDNNLNFGKLYSDFGHLYFDKGKDSEAKAYYAKALRSLSQKEAQNSTRSIDYKIYINQKLSKIHLRQENIDSSFFFVQKALNLQVQKYQSRRITSYEILGDICIQEKRYGEAMQAYCNSRDVAFETYKKFAKHEKKARTVKNIADTYLSQNQMDSALHYFQSALVVLSIDFDSLIPISNPLPSQMISLFEGLEITLGKAKAFDLKYQHTKDLNFLSTALDNYLQASAIIQSMRNRFLTAGSKNLLAEKTLEIYEGSIRTALALFESTKDLNYLETAWQFAEQNKARTLEESLQHNFAKLTSGLPNEILSQEEKLRKEINFYRKKINKEKSKAGELVQEKIETWNTLLFNKQNELSDFSISLEKEYPKYRLLKYETKQLEIKEVRGKLLTNNNAILEYFIGEEHIYLFVLTKEDFQIYEQELDVKKLNEVIAGLSFLFNKSPFDPGTDYDKDFAYFATEAHQLYLNLLAPALSKLSIGTNELIIIPDDVLAFLPFEVLLQEPVNNLEKGFLNANCNYLINDYAISYNYSTNLLLNYTQDISKNNVLPFLGFAPSFGNKVAEHRSCSVDEIYSLQCNVKENNTINKVFKGKTFNQLDATANSFYEHVAKANIVHMATHACIDEENPDLNKIFFADEYITSADLSNLQLNAELAVLSACNTGSGKLIRGEGVMSLSRNFMLSGCASTLMSLWSVDDCTTSEIMVHFYEALNAGNAKDEALRVAKLNHLSAADKVMSHPYYWAAFVQSGNARPLEKTNFSFSWWLLLGVLSLPLLYLMGKRIT